MKRLLTTTAIVIGALWFGAPVEAAPIALTLTQAGSHEITKNASTPCVIAGTNCKDQPAGFGYNNFKQGGNIKAYNAFSTTLTTQLDDGKQGTPYTAGQIGAALNTNHFNVAIDVNTSKNEEQLTAFEVFINGIMAFEFQSGPSTIGAVNNGNGSADWIIGDISLANYKADATVYFHAVWDRASGGAESFFFLVGLPNLPCTDLTVCPATSSTGDPSSVPEPAGFALLGVGMLGLAAAHRRRT